MQEIIDKLRKTVTDGRLGVERRLFLLRRLYAAVAASEEKIAAALKADFNKNAFDTYATETGLVLEEIRHAVRHLRGWAKPKRARISLKNFPAKGRIFAEPYGVALIVAPWNYPFQLALTPLVGAVAAGNAVVLKPSSKTPRTYAVLRELLEETFSPDEVWVTADRAVLDCRFDYIFFTGGAATGRTVLEKAARYLTPVSLELGGKSPAIVDAGADIPAAARRLAWAKYLNAGQTCVAPDYFLVHRSVYDAFSAAFLDEIRVQYYDADGTPGGEFAHLISEEKGRELNESIAGAKLLAGGPAVGRLMPPTVLEADFGSPIMRGEIFGPVAPLIPFDDISEVLDRLSELEKPLALYYFGKDRTVVERARFGGGCVGDAVMHVSEGALPFGGVGGSGMGRYHGKASFDTFTHYKSVLYKGKREIKARYAPHTEKKTKLLKKVEK